jgi:hypothetical protein
MEISELRRNIKSKFDLIASKNGAEDIEGKQISKNIIKFGYIIKGCGIEIQIELDDFFIFLLFFRVNGKEIPLGYEDQGGRPQKMYIHQVLNKLGVDHKTETKEMQKLRGDDINWEAMANILVKLLEDNLAQIVKNWDYIF